MDASGQVQKFEENITKSTEVTIFAAADSGESHGIKSLRPTLQTGEISPMVHFARCNHWSSCYLGQILSST